MSPIEDIGGYLVADAHGRPVGHVECPLYGSAEHVPDALAVRSGFLFHRHYVVPAGAVRAVDDRAQIVGLTVDRRELRRFL